MHQGLLDIIDDTFLIQMIETLETPVGTPIVEIQSAVRQELL